MFGNPHKIHEETKLIRKTLPQELKTSIDWAKTQELFHNIYIIDFMDELMKDNMLDMRMNKYITMGNLAYLEEHLFLEKSLVS